MDSFRKKYKKLIKEMEIINQSLVPRAESLSYTGKMKRKILLIAYKSLMFFKLSDENEN